MKSIFEQALAFQAAVEIFNEVERTTDPALRTEMLGQAVRYARLRVDWLLAGIDRDPALDASRSRAHDAFIDSLNILSREAARRGQSVSWRERLGDDRKVIGDFACYLHAILGLQAR